MFVGPAMLRSGATDTHGASAHAQAGAARRHQTCVAAGTFGGFGAADVFPGALSTAHAEHITTLKGHRRTLAEVGDKAHRAARAFTGMDQRDAAQLRTVRCTFRHMSPALLIDAAGGDPWQVNNTLQSGNPAVGDELTQAFPRRRRLHRRIQCRVRSSPPTLPGRVPQAVNAIKNGMPPREFFNELSNASGSVGKGLETHGVAVSPVRHSVDPNAFAKADAEALTNFGKNLTVMDVVSGKVSLTQGAAEFGGRWVGGATGAWAAGSLVSLLVAPEIAVPFAVADGMIGGSILGQGAVDEVLGC